MENIIADVLHCTTAAELPYANIIKQKSPFTECFSLQHLPLVRSPIDQIK
jgi:hypothetical protein